MRRIPRSLDATLRRHLGDLRQMAFVTGPRQVGKTTVCRDVGSKQAYLNWDDQDDREVILAGPGAVADHLDLALLREGPPVVVFDELHKYRRWRTFLKGFYDRHHEGVRIVVTGSARFDVFRRSGDSLMGRYFRYRLHPLSVGELVRPGERDREILPPRQPEPADWEALVAHGGFPEPFVHADARFSRRWQGLRSELLIRQDVRDLTRIQELDQLEMLVRVLAGRSGAQVNYTALSNQVRTSVDTMRRWIGSLCQLHHGFLIRPWFRNVARSLRKEPKWYLRDWSTIDDPGSRAETMTACHLKKAVDTWEDAGLGTYALHYLRDKEKREVDFLVVRNSEPWFLVEVKRTERAISPHLRRFHTMLGAPHSFQVALDLPFVDADCFERTEPTIVPAMTLLSQLP